MRINPGLQVHSLVDGSMLIGSGSNALWISGLSAEERLFVHSLGAGQTAPAEPVRVPPSGGERRQEILRLLRPVLVEETAPALNGLTGSLLAADAAQWSAAYGLDAREAMARRGGSTVCIRGLDRSGQQLAWILAAAGIGGLILEDPAPLAIGDLGNTPLRIPDVGHPRAGALRKALLRVHPRLRVTDSAVNEPGVQENIVEVLFGSAPVPALPADPKCLGLLPVTLLDDGARIGPLLIPGFGLCLPCFGAQPGAGGNPSKPVTASTAPPPRPELSLAATTAGIAATQCLMLIDQVNIPACADSVMEIDLASGAVSRLQAATRAGCTCLERLRQAA